MRQLRTNQLTPRRSALEYHEPTRRVGDLDSHVIAKLRRRLVVRPPGAEFEFRTCARRWADVGMSKRQSVILSVMLQGLSQADRTPLRRGGQLPGSPWGPQPAGLRLLDRPGRCSRLQRGDLDLVVDRRRFHVELRTETSARSILVRRNNGSRRRGHGSHCFDEEDTSETNTCKSGRQSTARKTAKKAGAP